MLYYDAFLDEYPEGKTRADFGNYDADYSYSQFKDDLEGALVDHFGRAAVKRGNKAFNIRENTYHVEADVVPLVEFRRYWETIQPPSISGKSSLDRHHRQRGEDLVAGIELHGHSGECPLPGRGAAHRPHEIGRIGAGEQLLDVPGFLPVGLQGNLRLFAAALHAHRPRPLGEHQLLA